MPSLSIFNRHGPSAAAAWSAAAVVLVIMMTGRAYGEGLDLSTLDGAVQSTVTDKATLYLDVFVNDERMRVIATAREDDDGHLLMQPSQLTEAGIDAKGLRGQREGWIDLSQLPNVTFNYDRLAQTIRFHAPDSARVARKVSARSGVDPMDATDPRNAVSSGTGALLNYTLNANSFYEVKKSDLGYGGMSGTFQGRVFGPAGFGESSVSLSDSDTRRLDSFWSYSDPVSMITYKAGDMITGGLSWTQPVRLAGVQIQRNFGLRPGLVTMPVPGFSGSAAVPSTVEVFLNNTRRFSDNIGSGPFEITDMPVITGAGDARVVVRDENGNETVTQSKYFVSDRLLKPELIDFSFEVGFPRTGFGTSNDRYDQRLFGAASLRLGLDDDLTFEAHAEGGDSLLNGGMALVSGIGAWGVGSLAMSGSTSAGAEGYEADAALETQLGWLHFQASAQHSFGDYHNIASVSRRDVDDDGSYFSYLSERTKSREQISASLPVFDKNSLNFSYTQLETVSGNRDRLLTASFTRPMLGGSFTLSGFGNTQTGDVAVLANLSIPIGGGVTASSSLQSDANGLSSYSTISRPAKQQNGDIGWQLQYQKDDTSRFVATTDIKTPVAKLRGSISQYDGTTYGRVQATGAVVMADDSIFLANRIDDAFAVVDAGVAGVTVLGENKPVGKTGRNGKLIVADLRSYERNQLGVDPTSLPLDVVTSSTSQAVVPAADSGVTVRFVDKSEGENALVVLRDQKNEFIQAGSSIVEGVAGTPIIVGYDGQALLTGVKPHNRLVILLPSGDRCVASFAYQARKGTLVTIPDVPCNPL